MKLISCTDKVIELVKEDFNNGEYPKFNFRDKVNNYANFLKQPLTLSMFVPCDDDGNVLSNPKDSTLQYQKKIDEYQQAKERVIFEGYKVIKFEDYYIIYDSHGRETWLSWSKSKTIESLINEITEVTITPNAVKTYQL